MKPGILAAIAALGAGCSATQRPAPPTPHFSIDVDGEDAGAGAQDRLSMLLDRSVEIQVRADESINGSFIASQGILESIVGGPTVCPPGTVEVEGDYCPVAEEICTQWSDDAGHVFHGQRSASAGRCDVFQRPTRCLAHRVHKRFCIDTFEYPNVVGQRPQSWMTWLDVKQACEEQGKRLCTRSEWTLACEGPDMQPYPYGDGYHRDDHACNTRNALPDDPDRIDPRTHQHLKISVFAAKTRQSAASTLLDQLLAPSGAMPDCVSPYGVHDQVGNIDEMVVNEAGKPHVSGLMGGHVFGPSVVRHACRPMTDRHDERFSWYETGGRCCLSPMN